MNCNSSKISEFGQKLGGKLAGIGARPSHSRQTFTDGQDWQRRSAVMYDKLKRGNTPPPGSMPRRSITLEACVVRSSRAVDADMIVSPYIRPHVTILEVEWLRFLDLGQQDCSSSRRHRHRHRHRTPERGTCPFRAVAILVPSAWRRG